MSLRKPLRYTLTMLTDKAYSDFINFYKLRCGLWKVITYISAHGTLRDLTLESGYGGIERIILNLDTETSIDDLRISILPLVMETTSTLGYREVTVRVRCGTSTKETSFSLQTLRLNVAKALERVVLLDDQIAEPEIWITGLGEVIENKEKLVQQRTLAALPYFRKRRLYSKLSRVTAGKLRACTPEDRERQAVALPVRLRNSFRSIAPLPTCFNTYFECSRNMILRDRRSKGWSKSAPSFDKLT
jgi:hypothetical protein